MSAHVPAPVRLPCPRFTRHVFAAPPLEQMGGFQEEENIPLFVKYCQLVFSRFGGRIK